MNQILYSKENRTEDSSKQQKSKNFSKFLKFQFVFLTILTVITTSYYFYLQYDKTKKESVSTEIVNRFAITNLYSNNETSSAQRISVDNTFQTDSGQSFKVVGLIEIDAIGINYPIIDTLTYDFLKIAPCKFYGPNPNEVGNLCIAGHNYNNYKFFSRLKKLNIGDTIYIYDLSRTKSSV